MGKKIKGAEPGQTVLAKRTSSHSKLKLTANQAELTASTQALSNNMTIYCMQGKKSIWGSSLLIQQTTHTGTLNSIVFLKVNVIDFFDFSCIFILHYFQLLWDKVK